MFSCLILILCYHFLFVKYSLTKQYLQIIQDIVSGIWEENEGDYLVFLSFFQVFQREGGLDLM